MLAPSGLVYVQTIAFILVIAVLVQMPRDCDEEDVAGAYAALGVFLPLITTNCAVLGVAIIVAQRISASCTRWSTPLPRLSVSPWLQL